MAHDIEIIDAEHTRKSKSGERHLAKGQSISMRMWDAEPAGITKEPIRSDYETVGYVISGIAEITIEGDSAVLTPGSSWVVPKGAEHTYRIMETFTAIEANSPPTNR
ncbi:cupin domain-containing protein [Lichenihabitans psoromatis]|uniref:cupin domain-containing protein n=1 Tax=Lichenihabitans psoromatis TaxID=2528642 RepID=UPI0010358A5F|nr:cupin domain-containing protein [Lichenihabitans psoromatis]